MKAAEIATLVDGKLYGEGDTEITSVAEITHAHAGQLAFTDKAEIPPTGASCVIVPEPFSSADRSTPSFVVASNPKLAFAKVAAILHVPKRHSHAEAISTTATVGKNVAVGFFATIGERSAIGDDTQIDAGVRIGTDVSIGKNCVLHSNVVVGDGCTLGDNVVLHAGVVIGADGFGYVRDTTRYVKFPQIGTVVIENNVEIGANTCVDRGALGETRIGEGTKIDNLVQVGHNVRIGKHCVIAAQTGISGSVTIEDDCVIGGQVGFGDHVHVQSGSVIGSQAGVLPGKIVRRGIWWGTPIQPLAEYKRQNAHIKSLERFKAEVKELRRKISEK